MNIAEYDRFWRVAVADGLLEFLVRIRLNLAAGLFLFLSREYTNAYLFEDDARGVEVIFFPNFALLV